jgi:hypothetical protein
MLYFLVFLLVCLSTAYQLSDYEASCIIPIFITRIGFISEENLRNSMRGIFSQFSKIYPSSKLFLMVLEKLLQQNTEARLESLPQLHQMLRSQGNNSSSNFVFVIFLFVKINCVPIMSLQKLTQSNQYIDVRILCWWSNTL